MNYTRRGWLKIKKEVKDITKVYSLKKTKELLLKDNFYKTLYGKAKNRTLLVINKKLFKSIYYYSKPLVRALNKQKTHRVSYNFAKRVMFIAEYNCDLERMRCQCGKKYNWTGYCRFCPEYHRTGLGKKHSDISILRMRISTLEYLSRTKGQLMPRYNHNSIKIIEEYGKKNGYCFQHAENGGEYHIKELGYFVDAYDKKNNIVLEIDERSHFDINGKLLEKDIVRQKQITEYLKCKFIRIKI